MVSLQVRLHNVLGGSRVRPTMAYFKSIKTTHKMGEHSTDFLMRLLHFVAMFCESFPKHTVVYGKMHTHTGVSLWHLMSFPYPFSAYRKAKQHKTRASLRRCLWPAPRNGPAGLPMSLPLESLQALQYSIKNHHFGRREFLASSLAGLAVQDLHGACAYKASSGNVQCHFIFYIFYGPQRCTKNVTPPFSHFQAGW